VFIKVWFRQLMYGRYPVEELWRINLAYVIAVGAGILLFVPGLRGKPWVGLFLLLGFPIIAFYLFVGGSFGLPEVETPLWGGLFLTLVISAVGIAASLPIGVVLALGRRSNMPVVRALCITFIELWRGVPLITVLFMASVMFPLFLPEGMNFDKLIRALVGVMFFSSAYMAEVVRGGLQALPKGQFEAAHALGLNYWKTMGLVILPQALKLVIPGIVNTFIGLFKDTTLVLIIGLFDFLGMIQLAGTNPDWLGFAIEGYVFAAFGFWIFCFSMSRYSQHLEKKLHTGH
jgi:general L-amino acid transport system permease protein